MAIYTGWTFSQIGDLTRLEIIALFCELKKERQEYLAQSNLLSAGLLKSLAYIAIGKKESNQAGETMFRKNIDHFKKLLEDTDNG